MRSFILALAVGLCLCPAASGQVVISQVNGNGGLTGDPFDRDFVELFNRGTSTVSLDGWSLLMFADAGTAGTPFNPTWTTLPLSGSIEAGQYFLVVPVTTRGGLGSTFFVPPLPPADVMATSDSERNLNSSANAIALMSSVVTLNTGDCPVGHPDLVDFVRYGHPTALCEDGSGPAPIVTSGVRACVRLDDGCTDTDQNINDLLTGQFPNPRNSASNAFIDANILDPIVVTGNLTFELLTVTRGNAACNPMPPGFLSSVTADLSAFGLPANQMLFDDGTNGDGGTDGIFSFVFDIPATQAPGHYVVPLTSVGNGGSPTLTTSVIVEVFPAPAPNDLCTSPIALAGTGPILYSDTLNTRNATADEDSGTCNGDSVTRNSIWFSYTPPTTGGIMIDERSSEDIVTSIFSACATASLICQRNDTGSFIPVEGGVPILIQIGLETAAGVPPQVPIDLTIHFEAAPVNDEPCGAIELADGQHHLTPNAAATTAIESIGISCDQGANPPEARRGVWYTYLTGPDGGAVTFTESSINNTDMSVFTSSDGTCAGIFSEVACLKESTARRIVSLLPNTRYFILFSLDTFSVIPSVPYDLDVSVLPPPANDLACNAEPVTLPASVSVNPVSAGSDLAFSSSSCSTSVNRYNGVWYTMTTGAEPGSIRVADFGDNDIFWTAYTGFDCFSLSPVACLFSEDTGVQVEANTTYWIMVSLESTSTTNPPAVNGDYDLLFEFYPTPVNDEPCDALEISSTPFNFSPLGVGYHADVDLTCNYNNPVQFTTGYGGWYHFNLPTAQELLVHDMSSDVLVFGLFEGSDCNTLFETDCKMGSNGDLFGFNAAAFNLQANTDYWLLVGKIANSQPFGFYDLDFTLTDAKGACCTPSGCTIATQNTCAGAFGGPFTHCGDTPQYSEFVGLPIPDHVGGSTGTPGVIQRTIEVTDIGDVNDLKVLIELNHARTGDLIVNIMAPGGFNADLMRRIDDDNDLNCPNNGSQGRLTDLGGTYIFDDQAYSPYGPGMWAAAKYFDFTGLVVPSGHYKASRCDALEVDFNPTFLGVSMTGTWTLTISDHQQSSTGTLQSWGLIINNGLVEPCQCVDGDVNSDGAINGDDIGPFLDCLFFSIGDYCECADIDNSNGVDNADVNLLVGLLLND